MGCKCTCIGNVILGKDVGVWFGSVLRGDNDVIKIGEETNIQENTIIHVDPDCPVTIGNNVQLDIMQSYTVVQ